MSDEPPGPGHDRRIWPGDADRGEIQILEERELWSNDHARFLLARVRHPANEGEASRLFSFMPKSRRSSAGK